MIVPPEVQRALKVSGSEDADRWEKKTKFVFNLLCANSLPAKQRLDVRHVHVLPALQRLPAQVHGVRDADQARMPAQVQGERHHTCGDHLVAPGATYIYLVAI